MSVSTSLGGGDQAGDTKQPEKKPGIVAVVNGTEVPLDDFYREAPRAWSASFSIREDPLPVRKSPA